MHFLLLMFSEMLVRCFWNSGWANVEHERLLQNNVQRFGYTNTKELPYDWNGKRAYAKTWTAVWTFINFHFTKSIT